MADITFTIGSDASRDFASVSAYHAAHGSDDLVTLDENHILELYNDDGLRISESAVVFTQTHDATHFLTMRPASGNGAGGHPNDHRTRGSSSPLIDDPLVGVALEMTATFSTMWEWDNTGQGPQKIQLFGIQARATGNRSGIIVASGADKIAADSIIDQCIFHVADSNGNTNVNGFTNDDGGTPAAVIRRSLIITNSDDRSGIAGFVGGSFDGLVEACTIVSTNTTTGSGINNTGGGIYTAHNTIAMGFGTDFSGGFDGDHNASSDTTSPGANSLDSLVLADIFENPVAGDAGDWRIKSGASVVGAGNLSTSTIEDIIDQTRDDPPTIGAWELLSASSGFTLIADTGSFALTGAQAALLAGRMLAGGAGSFALTGAAAGLLAGRNLSAETGAFSLAGSDASLTADRLLAAGGGSLALTGADAGLLAGRRIAANTGSFALSGADAGLTIARILAAASGGFTLTGADAALLRGFAMAAGTGSFVLTGADAGLVADRRISADTGAFTLTGADAGLIVSGTITLNAETGAFTLTGADGGLLVGRVLRAEAGNFALAGADAALLADRSLAAGAGSFALNGAAAGLFKGYNLTAAPGVFALDGAASGFIVARNLTAGTGSFTLTGSAAALVFSGEFVGLDTTTPGGQIALQIQQALVEAGDALSGASGDDIARQIRDALREAGEALGE